MNVGVIELYSLQKIDSELDKLQRKYAAFDRGASEKVDLEQKQAIAASSEAESNRITTELHDAELEVVSVRAKSKEFHTKLYSGSVTNFKELQSMEHEVEALNRQAEKLDLKIVDLKASLALALGAAKLALTDVNAATEAYEKKLRIFKANERVLKVEAQRLMAERTKVTSSMDPILLKTYDTMKKNHKQGIAVALLDGDSCSACKTTLPSTLVSAVKTSDDAQKCDNCGRLLCYLR